MNQQKEALRLLEEALKELETPKGSVLSAVQKLSRASGLIGNEDVKAWCAIQLGDSTYTAPLSELLLVLSVLLEKTDTESKENKDAVSKAIKPLDKLNLKHELHYSNEELNVKANDSGGGYTNIGFIEERYADLVRTKRGNDGHYYKNQLNNHINYVRKKAHELASALFNQIKFSGAVSSCFDVLKEAVDDQLLDLNPPLAEQLMLAFKAVSSNKEEEWSQALTTCRRLLEGLADQLYPPVDGNVKGRPLSQANYVNRLWAFMDASIQSASNKELAKTHVDFLGSWMEKANKITNKGVHASVTQLEAVKAVFHTYLVIADILEYLSVSRKPKTTIDINSATIDELEALLEIRRSVAKEIVKARVQVGALDLEALAKISGIGPKTLEKAAKLFAF